MLIKITVLVLFCCLTKLSFSQSPGGVGTSSLVVWLKANQSVYTTTTTLAVTGQTVHSWADQSGARTQRAAIKSGHRPTSFYNDAVNNLNYNPVVKFDTLTGMDFSSDYVFSSGTGLSNGMTWFSVLKPNATTGTKNAQFVFDFGLYANAGYGFLYGNTGYSIYSSDGALGGAASVLQIHGRGLTKTLSTFKISYASDQALYFDGSKTAAIGTQSAITLSNLNATTINENPTSTTLAGPFSIGSQSKSDLLTNNGGRYLWANVAELIGYDKNMTAAEIVKVESYLAIKYGITLSKSGGGANGNYTASNGNTVWTASLSPSYHNNVIGIVRDDNEALLQKQSKTNDDSVMIYRGTLSLTNSANTATFSGTPSYVMIGDNGGKLCSAFPITELTASCGILRRIEREWKVTKTNFADAFNMNIKLNNCAALGSINVSQLRLLVDDDGDFSNGGTSCYYNGDAFGTVISYANPVITFSNITGSHIPNNATRYLTLGSIDFSTPLPVELLYFNAECGTIEGTTLLKWSTATETGNDVFEISKSTDALHWTPIAQLNGTGIAAKQSLYEYTDLQISPAEIVYYRLTHVTGEKTGNRKTETYSSTISRRRCVAPENIRFFPNPASDEIFLDHDGSYTHYAISDQLGRNLQAGPIHLNRIALDALADGLYFITFTKPDGKGVCKKLYINKK